MKKMLSIAAVAALATSSFAASDLAGAFKEGKTSGQVRAMYLKQDFSSDMNDATKGNIRFVTPTQCSVHALVRPLSYRHNHVL